MLSFFPLDVLDELWDVTESVSEGFFTYCCSRYIISRIKGYTSSNGDSDKLAYLDSSHSLIQLFSFLAFKMLKVYT